MSKYKPRWNFLIVALFVVILTMAACFYIQNAADRNRVEVFIDMYTSNGATAELYINDFSKQPFRAPIQPGRREVYRFTGLPGTIDVLRFDPTDAKSARIQIYGVVIAVNGTEARRFGPAEIRKWERYNATAEEASESLVLESSTTDPIILGHPKYTAPVSSIATPILASPLGVGSAPNIFFALVVVALSVSLFAPTSRYHLPLVLVSGSSLFVTVTLLLKRQGLPPSPKLAVGFAAWSGFAKSVEILAVWAGFVVALAAPVLLNWLLSRRPTVDVVALEDRPKKSFYWMPVLVLLLLGALFMPDLRAAGRMISAYQYQNEWDLDNVTLWKYMRASGWLPYKDFWYPYGFLDVFGTRFPFAQIVDYLHWVLSPFELFLALFLCTGRRSLFPFLVLLALLSSGVTDLPFWHRYLLSINIVLSYAAFQSGVRSPYREVFFVWTVAHAFLMDPSQVLYSGPAILLKNTLDYFTSTQQKGFRPVIRNLVHQFRFVLIFVALFCGFLALRGQLAGAWRFYGGLGTVALYSEIPAAIREWIRPSLSFTAMLLVASSLVSLGVFIRLRANRQDHILSNLLLLSSVTTFMAIQKWVIRPPGVAEEILVMAVVSSLIYIYVCFAIERGSAARLAFFIFVGVVAALAFYKSVPKMMFQRLEASIPLAAGNISFLSDASALRSVRLNEYSQDRFKGNTALYQVYSFLRTEAANASSVKVYVLGDDPILYILLGQKAPYQTNLFNASPIFEQQIVSDWLEQSKPDYVVWNPTQNSFDTVPNVVRCPLIYEKVIQDFVPYKAVGNYEILRRKLPGQPIDIEFWRARLGESIDVGHLARLSSAADLRGCEASSSTACSQFLHVIVHEGQGNRIEIPVHIGASEFVITFSSVVGESDYVVALDRIWFWQASRLQGKIPQLGTLSPQLEARIFFKESDPAVLY